jgi:hypothetical protein
MTLPSRASSPWSSPEGGDRWRKITRRLLADATPVLLMLLATLLFVASLPVLYGMAVRQRIPAAQRGIARYVYARGLLAKRPTGPGTLRYSPQPVLPGHPVFSQPGADQGPLIREFSAERPGIGVARRMIVIRKRADAEAPVVAQVGRGKALAVVKELGDWLLVAIRQDEKMLFGWVKHADVAVLP